MDDRSGKRAGIYGRSGSGKSHFAKVVIRNVSRIVAFDPEGEYVTEKGFHAVSTLAGLLDVLKDCQGGNFRIAYVPQALREERELHEVSKLLEWLQAPFLAGESDRKVTLLVDEMNLSFPVNPKPEFDGFARLCSRGRKRGINIIGVTQRPAEVSTRFRGNVDQLHVFRLAAPQDFDAIRGAIGAEGEGLVRDLGEYEHVFFNNGDVTVEKPV